MTTVLEWLLGLEQIHLGGDAPLSIRLESPPAAWLQLVGVVLAAMVVVFLYRREAVSAWRRRLLIALRMGAIGVILLMLARPILVLQRNTVDPSVVAVLVDRSASMAVRDEANVDRVGTGRRRWDRAVASLEGSNGLLAELLKRHQVDLWTFAASAERVGSLARRADTPPLTRRLDAQAPDGRRTDVVGAMAETLQQMHGRRLSGLVIISDGRQNMPQQLESAVTLAGARSVPVHVVAVGSTRPRRDIAITSIWADEHVFVHDPVGIRVQLNATGYDDAVEVDVQLRDQATDTLLASQTHSMGGASESAEAEFRFRPRRGGRRSLRVVAVPRDDEQARDNNAADVTILVHDEKISVLYVEGRPRFEYRYLKNLIAREATLESSCLLVSADPEFPQEGTRPIRRFPDSIETLLQYDVVILGDVDPRGPWVDAARIAMLDDFVSVHGGGIAFVAGERHMPQALHRSPLARLLPVKIDPAFYGRYESSLRASFSLQLTTEGRESSLFHLDVDERERTDLVRSLPGWFWYARVLGPKPGAQVLAIHPTVTTPTGEPMPLVVLGRYGAGRTCYIGSDDVWRWRRYSGDVYYENIWMQTVRTLARGRRLGGERRWRLETDHRVYDLGRKVRVRLRAGESLAPGEMESAVVDVTDGQNGLIQRVTLSRLGPRARTFEGTFIPRRTGSYTLSVSTPRRTGPARIPSRTITVSPSDPERHRSEADYAFLRLIASRTGGEFHRLDADPKALVAALPDRSELVRADIEEPLWDTRLALLLFIMFIVAEWAIRKVQGLA